MSDQSKKQGIQANTSQNKTFSKMNKKSQKEIICFCNQIPKDEIVKAMQEGACTLNEIYDKTTAGVGPCGGSCRRKIAPLLEEFLKSKKL